MDSVDSGTADRELWTKAHECTIGKVVGRVRLGGGQGLGWAGNRHISLGR